MECVMEDDGTGDTRHETRYEKVTEYWRGWESKLLTLSEGIFIFWTTSTDVNNMRNCARHGYKFTMKWFYMNVFAWELLDYVLRWRKLWQMISLKVFQKVHEEFHGVVVSKTSKRILNISWCQICKIKIEKCI